MSKAGLTTPEKCWELWAVCQRLSNSDTDFERARLGVETHLVRIAQHHPFDQIRDIEERTGVEALRRWFHEVFLNVKD